jgi:hypothetical protein
MMTHVTENFSGRLRKYNLFTIAVLFILLLSILF